MATKTNKFSKEDMDILRDAFDSIDTNENGFIEKRELATLIKKTCEDVEAEFNMDLVDSDFRNSDDNHDQKLSFDEFVEHLHDYVV